MLPPDITPEKARQMLAGMGVDPNQIQQQAQPTPAPQRTTGYGNWGAWPNAPQQKSWRPGERWPIYTGGTVFGILGGLLGGPPGAVGGAALGGMWGKAGMVDEAMTEGELDVDQPLWDIYKPILKEGAIEGATEGIGWGVAGLGKRALAPLAKKVVPGIKRLGPMLADAGTRIPREELTEHAAKHLMKRGGESVVIPTPGQTTLDPLLDLIENMAEGSAVGGGHLYTLKKVLQPKALKVLSKELSEKFWSEAGERMSGSQVGNLFAEAITNKKVASQRIIRMLYGNVDQLTKGMTQVDLTPLKQMAEALEAQARLSKGLGSAQGITRLTRKVGSLGDEVSFKVAQEIRSNILEETRKLEGLLNVKMPKVDRAAQTLASQLDEIMEQTAKAHSPEAYQAWRTANAATKKLYADVLSNQYIEAAIKLADKNPQKIASYLFQPDAVGQVLAAKKILPKKTWNALVAAKMEELIKGATKPMAGDIAETVGVMKGRTFLGAFNDLGDDVLSEMFSPEHIQHIRDIGAVHRLVQDPIGRGGGGMLIQLMQAGAVIGAITGDYTKEAAGMILGPDAVGRLLTSPAGAKWLSVGLKTPSWSPAAGAVLSRILKESGMENVPQPSTKKKTDIFGGFKERAAGLRGWQEKENWPFNIDEKRTELLLKQTR